MRFSAVAVALSLPLAACGGNSSAVPDVSLTSPAFLNLGSIPTQYSCAGQGQTIPLTVGRLPQGTQSLALLMEDLDTKPSFIHWMAWNIPAQEGDLTVTQTGTTVVSLNSSGTPGYAPPCPPEDSARNHADRIE